MPRDIAIQKSDFSFVTQSLGKLYSFHPNVGEQILVSERLNKSFQNTFPEEYAKTLISVLCHPENKLPRNKEKPNKISLTLDDVKEINVDELEEFSSLYLKKYDYLFRRVESKKPLANEGPGNSISIGLGKIISQRKQDETSLKYLYRLNIILEKEFGEKVGFSKKLETEINKTIKRGRELRNIYNSLESREITTISTVSSKLETLNEISKDTLKFITQTNEIQTQIAEELKSSGDVSSFYSKKSVFYNKLIITLTLFSIFLSAFAIFYSVKSSKQQSHILDKHAVSIVETLSEINSELKKSNELNNKLPKQSDTLNKETIEQKKLITNQPTNNK